MTPSSPPEINEEYETTIEATESDENESRYFAMNTNGYSEKENKEQNKISLQGIKIRKNLQEMAFFYPQFLYVLKFHLPGQNSSPKRIALHFGTHI